MVKKQQMRWSLHGAHMLTQVRTTALNGGLRDRFRAPFRQPDPNVPSIFKPKPPPLRRRTLEKLPVSKGAISIDCQLLNLVPGYLVETIAVGVLRLNAKRHGRFVAAIGIDPFGRTKVAGADLRHLRQ